MDIFCDNLIRILLQKMDLWGTIKIKDLSSISGCTE